MTKNRLKYYEPETRLGLPPPLEANYLDTIHDRRIVIITVIQHDFSDNQKEIESNWSNEIFNYIAESLKEIKAVTKIIIDVSQKDLIRIWSVIKKENKEIVDKIYMKEIEIIGYLANFNYDIDFHVISEDMIENVIDENAKIVFDANKAE